jgi:hypothetical protein
MKTYGNPNVNKMSHKTTYEQKLVVHSHAQTIVGFHHTFDLGLSTKVGQNKVKCTKNKFKA